MGCDAAKNISKLSLAFSLWGNWFTSPNMTWTIQKIWGQIMKSYEITTNFSVHPFVKYLSIESCCYANGCFVGPYCCAQFAVSRDTIRRHDKVPWCSLMQPYAHLCQMEYELNPTTSKKVAKQCKTDKYETFMCFLCGVTPWCFIYFLMYLVKWFRDCFVLPSVLGVMQMYHHCFWNQSFDLVHLSCVQLLFDEA